MLFVLKTRPGINEAQVFQTCLQPARTTQKSIGIVKPLMEKAEVSACARQALALTCPQPARCLVLQLGKSQLEPFIFRLERVFTFSESSTLGVSGRNRHFLKYSCSSNLDPALSSHVSQGKLVFLLAFTDLLVLGGLLWARGEP